MRTSIWICCFLGAVSIALQSISYLDFQPKKILLGKVNYSSRIAIARHFMRTFSSDLWLWRRSSFFPGSGSIC